MTASGGSVVDMREDRMMIEDIERQGLCPRWIWTHVAAGLFVIAVVVVVVVATQYDKPTRSESPNTASSISSVGFYGQAAVAADALQCSEIGRDVLRENGSAVDAAIAAMLCSGVHNAHSAGIGGGFFMVAYDTPKHRVDGRTGKQILAFDARETAPASASYDSLPPFSSQKLVGGASIAVPGEVMGYFVAWNRFGRLPWRRLFQPTIDMCRHGFRVGASLAHRIETERDAMTSSPSLRAVFLKGDGTPYREGDILKLPKMADTLDAIARDDGAKSMYDGGTLANNIVDDLRELGANITASDLRNYRVRVQPAIEMPLRNGDVLLTTRPPSSGALFGLMLRVIEGFNFSVSDSHDVDTYHKLAETFKFAYSMRTYLGDDKFFNITEALTNITSPDFADYIRNRIYVDRTHDVPYYKPAYYDPPVESGTSHLSVLAPDGSAASITSTINSVFGSRLVGSRTGILFNDEMNDFWRPRRSTSKISPLDVANSLAPGKRPLSAMCPSIVVNSNGNVAMVIGAAGEARITSATALVAAKKLWLGRTMGGAIDDLRFYHQLMPNKIRYDKGFSTQLLDSLREKGHEIDSSPLKTITVVQAIHVAANCSRTAESGPTRRCIEAVCDWRKSGAPSGF